MSSAAPAPIPVNAGVRDAAKDALTTVQTMAKHVVSASQHETTLTPLLKGVVAREQTILKTESALAQLRKTLAETHDSYDTPVSPDLPTHQSADLLLLLLSLPFFACVSCRISAAKAKGPGLTFVLSTAKTYADTTFMSLAAPPGGSPYAPGSSLA
jgi:hypothetical protein